MFSDCGQKSVRIVRSWPASLLNPTFWTFSARFWCRRCRKMIVGEVSAYSTEIIWKAIWSRLWAVSPLCEGPEMDQRNVNNRKEAVPSSLLKSLYWGALMVPAQPKISPVFGRENYKRSRLLGYSWTSTMSKTRRLKKKNIPATRKQKKK